MANNFTDLVSIGFGRINCLNPPRGAWLPNIIEPCQLNCTQIELGQALVSAQEIQNAL